jgi:hypothetical protein
MQTFPGCVGSTFRNLHPSEHTDGAKSSLNSLVRKTLLNIFHGLLSRKTQTLFSLACLLLAV